jgi:ADP-heptose:LPS heptosyltransferase
MQKGHLPDIQKIAVVRANGLGDFIFALPALAALRAAYPGAEIVLLGLAWHAAFLRERPSPVDRVLVVPPYTGVSVRDDQPGDELACEQFFQQARREQFDLACQMHGGGRHSNPFLLRLGACLTIGLKTPDAPALNRWIPYRYYQQEVARYLEVVSLVGATPITLEPRIAITRRDQAELANILPRELQPLVVLHPGASDPRRRWPGEKFALVGDTLAAHGARIAITGTEDEREAVESVANAMRGEALNLCGKLSLGALADLLASSRVVISNDSGPLYLAQAVGARTVGLYWAFNLLTAALPFRRDHAPLVSWQLTCPDCRHDLTRSRCSHTSSLVDLISTEEVIEAAREMFARPAYPGERKEDDLDSLSHSDWLKRIGGESRLSPP